MSRPMQKICLALRRSDTLLYTMPIWIVMTMRAIDFAEISEGEPSHDLIDLPPLQLVGDVEVHHLIAILQTLDEVTPQGIWPIEARNRNLVRSLTFDFVTIMAEAVEEARRNIEGATRRLAGLQSIVRSNIGDGLRTGPFALGEFSPVDALMLCLGVLSNRSGMPLSSDMTAYLRRLASSAVVRHWCGSAAARQRPGVGYQQLMDFAI